MNDSFSTRDSLDVNGTTYAYASLAKLGERFDLKRLPYSMKILLENLLRNEDGANVTAKEIEAVATWDAKKEPDTEIAFTPARVVLQDFTGVPCVVDLAAMRDAMKNLGGDPELINPLSPAELVIDHSVQVDKFGNKSAIDENVKIEFERNQERYSFLRWGQKALDNFKVVPPRTGIVHQVNLEHLARVVMGQSVDGQLWAYPDTVFGTDSHTTMINGLGVLGWGVGGIEAEAAMLGQPSSMLIPQVVGFKLTGKLPEGATATDLVLTVTQMLRKHGVVGKFVEFFGEGLKHLPLADRATIANMAPEYGATCGIFPVDAEALNYMRLSGRGEQQIALVEAYARAQGLWHDANTPHAEFTATLELDMGEVKPSMAGPKRPQDRVLLSDVKKNFHEVVGPLTANRKGGNGDAARFANEGGDTAVGNPANAVSNGAVTVEKDGQSFELKDGAVVIAAITSCTNTSNPAVMLGAGLVAKKAAALGLKAKPWVKPSLGPGSKVVTDYLEATGLMDELEKVGFYLVGYGCTTCIGNSGPLPPEISKGINKGDLAVASVLSGNRNFEGRVHPEVKMNYLASPPLVVAYALAGTLDIDLDKDPIGQDADGKDVFLKDIWPTNKEIGDLIASSITAEMFTKSYADVFKGDERWNAIASPDGKQYAWDDASTYIKNPPYFDGMTMELDPVEDIHDARCLGLFGDSITTDHISPAGAIKKDSPAGRFLIERGVQPAQFNSYGSRRGNDVFLKDIWPTNKEISDLIASSVTADMFSKSYADVFKGDERWNAIASPDGKQYAWEDASTYIKNPPYFDGMTMEVEKVEDIHGARCLGLFGDSITTDHISPAGAIKKDSPAGRYLIERGVQPAQFNSYGSRRGNDDVMVRGTFANIRIRNQMLDGVEGGYTKYVPTGEQMAMYDAAMKYKADNTPLIVLAGKEYGTGSSRDWAAKGTLLLGVKAVIAESFERIHRSNLVGMGVLPLQFKDGDSASSLGLDGTETFEITGLDDGHAKEATVVAKGESGEKTFSVRVMLLTPKERDFYRHGGILQYVLRDLAAKKAA